MEEVTIVWDRARQGQQRSGWQGKSQRKGQRRTMWDRAKTRPLKNSTNMEADMDTLSSMSSIWQRMIMRSQPGNEVDCCAEISHAAKACVKSVSRSSLSSIPTERRIMESAIPIDARL